MSKRKPLKPTDLAFELPQTEGPEDIGVLHREALDAIYVVDQHQAECFYSIFQETMRQRDMDLGMGIFCNTLLYASAINN